MTTAWDRTYFANAMLSELLTGIQAHKDPSKWRLLQLQVTDCKSLFDGIASENPRTTEKRTFIDIRSIQEFVNYKTIHWVPTTVQFADGLTKCCKSLRAAFRDWLCKPYVKLREAHEKKNSRVTICEHQIHHHS